MGFALPSTCFRIHFLSASVPLSLNPQHACSDSSLCSCSLVSMGSLERSESFSPAKIQEDEQSLSRMMRKNTWFRLAKNTNAGPCRDL